mmetsp:Transcript_26187/g.63831  ORF Transcript_26187/g.63831 Transcript_26187/m.63831 type:complete len:95 (-) Transcript_26187:56-340(-)
MNESVVAFSMESIGLIESASQTFYKLNLSRDLTKKKQRNQAKMPILKSPELDSSCVRSVEAEKQRNQNGHESYQKQPGCKIESIRTLAGGDAFT